MNLFQMFIPQGLNFQLAAVLFSLGIYSYIEYGKLKDNLYMLLLKFLTQSLTICAFTFLKHSLLSSSIQTPLKQ